VERTLNRSSFWSRMGEWFKSSNRGIAVTELSSTDSLTVNPTAPSSGNLLDPGPDDDAPSDINGRGRFSGRRRELKRVEDGYNRVVGLVESLQAHFEEQDRRTADIAASLERLATSLSHMPEASRGQFEVLSAMRDVLEHHAARAKRFEDCVTQLPQLADAQRETMTAIAHQLDHSHKSNDRVGAALENFQQAVASLSEATAGSTVALREMHNDSSARESRMVTMLDQQARRFTFFACVAVGMGVIVAGLGLLTAWLR
jgi:uncharacterized membrane protein YccC